MGALVLVFFQKEWDRSCRRVPPTSVLRPGKFGGLLGGGLRGLGFTDTLTPDYSLWGDYRRPHDLVGRHLGSSRFQKAHPSVVQATINIWG